MLGHLGAEDRAITPYFRDRGGILKPIAWDAALDRFTSNFKQIQEEYGKDAVAFISTGQITNEEHAFLGALAKFGMGIKHGDGNTRQCMATAVVAHKQTFGWDAPPFTYKDFELSDVMVFFGSNPVVAHPILWNRVKMNQNEPKILVIDPRNSETAQEATNHFAIRPKGELYLVYALAQSLIERDWIDKEFIKEHTNGFEDFKSHVQKYKFETVRNKIGLNESEFNEFAKIIHEGKRVSFWWMVGINQSHQATRTAQGIINLALITGNIGKPGTGANSITGQCNAMGARIFSNTTSLLGGHKFDSEKHRKKVAGILNIPIKTIPTEGSWSYDRILEGINKGEIKGLWIVCTNPAHSWVNNTQIPDLFQKLDYLVVQDMFYTTETAELADLILPAAGNGEKTGTFINSERRIALTEQATVPPGKALPDFEIFKKIAVAWGCDMMFEKWSTPEATFNLIKELTRDLPWDFTGINSYGMLLKNGGIQWPFPNDSHKPPIKERRLYVGGKFYHSDGKAKFIFEDIFPDPEEVNSDYPYILITGRGTVVQWHTQTRTIKAPLLARSTPEEPYIEISQNDAKKMDLKDEEWVHVTSRRGTSKVKVIISEKSLPGSVFMPLHYAETNVLTMNMFDPYSKEPQYKFSAVNIKKV